MKNQKGFINIAMVFVLLVIAGTAGYFVLNKNQQSPIANVKQNTEKENTVAQSFATTVAALSATSTSVPKVSKSSVLIFADETTYQQLTSDLNRLAKDIEKDLGTKVEIRHSNWASPIEIRNVIKDSYQNKKGLLGSLLIGDIPTFHRVNSSFYTDRWYEELSDRCQLDSSGTIQNVFGCGDTQDATTQPDIFVGRIKPPVGGAEGIQLIKKYLDKNHAYRTGALSYSSKMLVFPSVDFNQNNISRDTFNSRLDSIAKQLQIYSRDQIDLLTTSGKQEYLDKLSQNYETALINIHGSSNSEWIGNDVYVSSDDIKNISPKILFIQLFSCANGAFQDQNYFAGWLLFSGNTLVVTANTVNTYILGLIPEPPFEPQFFFELNPLRLGAPIGEMVRRDLAGTQEQIFGDPTLRLRQPVQPTAKDPKISFIGSTVDFGKVMINQSVTKTYIIENKGKSNLEIVKEHNIPFTVDGQNPLDPSRTPPRILYAMGFSEIEFPPHEKVVIKPGQKKQFTLYFRPYASGKYLGLDRLYTNDPRVPYLDIQFLGEGSTGN